MSETEEQIRQLSEELKNLMHYDEGYNEIAINHVIDQLDKLRLKSNLDAVSYTHLTLPTILRV